MPRNLVTLVASRLMEATAWTAAEVTQEVVATLAEVFDADAAFLRNNYGIGASKLIAEWPPRPDRPDPDPLAVIPFTSADPVFAYCAYETSGLKGHVWRAAARDSDVRNRLWAIRRLSTYDSAGPGGLSTRPSVFEIGNQTVACAAGGIASVLLEAGDHRPAGTI